MHMKSYLMQWSFGKELTNVASMFLADFKIHTDRAEGWECLNSPLSVKDGQSLSDGSCVVWTHE